MGSEMCIRDRSCHPKGYKRSIPYSQALRLKRICPTPASFENRAKELTHFLVARGYQYKFVCDQIQKVRGKDREKLIKCNTQPPCDRITFTVTYHPCLPNIGGFLKELHLLLQLSDRCNQAVPRANDGIPPAKESTRLFGSGETTATI